MAEALMQDQALPEATHQDMANAIRALAMDAVQKANSGHPGMPMGMADVATVLFTRFLKFDAAHPDWPDRDRFVLSAGHGSMLLYALLYLTGYPEMELEELKHFRQLGSAHAGPPGIWPCAGHRDDHRSARPGPRQRRRHGARRAAAQRAATAMSIVNHYTYCVAGDGCLMEGISHEAISLAGHLKLGRLIVLFDDNQISIDGPTSLSVSDDQIERFKASRWHTARVDGHDPEAIALGHRECASRHRPALADRLPHRHRLWRAEQGRHRRDPRFAARRGGDRGRAREAALAASALRGAEADPCQLARGRRAAPRGLRELGRRRRSGSMRRARRPHRSHRRQGRGRDRRRHRRGQVGLHPRRRQARDAAILAEGAGEAAAGRSRPDRRLGRPHRLERHAHQAAAS